MALENAYKVINYKLNLKTFGKFVYFEEFSSRYYSK